jgi:hypothetical protein
MRVECREVKFELARALPDRKAPQQHAAEVEVVFDGVLATS